MLAFSLGCLPARMERILANSHFPSISKLLAGSRMLVLR
jgi:hypothetical protein